MNRLTDIRSDRSRLVRGSLPLTIAAVLAAVLALGGVASAMRATLPRTQPSAARAADLTRTQPWPAAQNPTPITARAAAPATPAATPPATPAKQPAPSAAASKAPSSEAVGFYVNWDRTSYESLAAHAKDLTTLSPMWMHLGNDGRVTLDGIEMQRKALDLVREKNPDMKIVPIVNNYDARSGKWNPKEMGVLLADPAKRERMADEIVRTAIANGYDGVNVDFEMLPPDSRPHLTAFMRTLGAKAKAKKLVTAQSVTVLGSAYDHKALAAASDYLVPMMYDEHTHGDPAGPVTSQGWYERMLGKMLKQVPAEKLVVGVGLYARDWSRDAESGRGLRFDEAQAMARRSGSVMTMDPASLNLTFKHGADGGGSTWVLDGASAFNQMAAGKRAGVKGYALWRLGQEEPGFWTVMNGRDALDADVAKSLERPGRSIGYDANRGLITSERITP